MPRADGKGRHDLVVIGASAGGVEALKTIASCLPPDLHAPIVVVERKRVRGRLASPRGCREIEALLAPWLR